MVTSRVSAGGTGEGWVECVDTRLVAAVQAAAGARCHEAASLVKASYFSAEACRRFGAGRGDASGATEARRRMVEAKVRLRDFLAERVLGWIGNRSSERWANVDWSPDAGRGAVATVS